MGKEAIVPSPQLPEPTRVTGQESATLLHYSTPVKLAPDSITKLLEPQNNGGMFNDLLAGRTPETYPSMMI